MSSEGAACPRVDALVSTLTAARREQRLSMAEVAARAGTVKSQIHSWEHRVKSPTLRGLSAWAAALGYAVTLTPADAEP